MKNCIYEKKISREKNAWRGPQGKNRKNFFFEHSASVDAVFHGDYESDIILIEIPYKKMKN